METFNYEALLEETLSSISKIKQTEFNIILIGPSGAGKSTLANALIGDGNLQFEVKNGAYFPIEQNNFKISLDVTQSMTKDPQLYVIDEQFSLVDLPGFGDSRSTEIDIRTNIYANALLNSGQKTLLLLLIPFKVFEQGKCQKIVEILNMVQETNVQIILIITKIDKEDSVEDMKSILEQCINNTDTKLEIKSKEILKQIIDQKHLLVLKKPLKINKTNIYKLYDDDIKIIEDTVKNKNIYKQSEFKISQSKESKELLEQYGQKLQKNLIELEVNLINSAFAKKLICASFEQDEYKKNQQIKDSEYSYGIKFKEYIQSVQAYNVLAPLIKQDLKKYDHYYNSLQKIDELFDYSEVQLQGKELYIRAIQYTASQLMTSYKGYSEKNILIETIYIYSQQTFCVDQDIKLPGVNLYIITQEFSVLSQTQINLKGSKGKPHPKATIENDILPYSLIGTKGQKSGSLYIQTKTDINLDLLEINLSGGDGGDGQEGADGQNGIDGEDGDLQMVKNKDEKCDFHFEEEPFNVAELALTFNRTFKCFYKSPGKPGTQGGHSRQGGIGGNVGLKGIYELTFKNQVIVIDQDSNIGAQGKDGQPGKGGKKGKDYVGIEKQIKIFGRTQDLKNLEKKQDNITQGVVGTVATEAAAVATGAAIATGVAAVKVFMQEVAVLSVAQVVKTAAIGAASVASFGIAIGAQILGTGIQILHSDHKWIEEAHPVENEEYAEPGEVLSNDIELEQFDLDAQIQSQQQDFQCGIEKFNHYQVKFNEWIKKEYPTELYNQLFYRQTIGL